MRFSVDKSLGRTILQKLVVTVGEPRAYKPHTTPLFHTSNLRLKSQPSKWIFPI